MQGMRGSSFDPPSFPIQHHISGNQFGKGTGHCFVSIEGSSKKAGRISFKNKLMSI